MDTADTKPDLKSYQVIGRHWDNVQTLVTTITLHPGADWAQVGNAAEQAVRNEIGYVLTRIELRAVRIHGIWYEIQKKGDSK
jgi:hypothetical protein